MITLQQAVGKKVLINRASNGKEFIIEGFLENGVVSYMDSNAGICYLSNETIAKMLPSLIGAPVCIDHQDINKENSGDHKKGEVTRAWFNKETGRFDCAITTDDPEVEEKIKNGWSASCAYNVTDVGEGGEWHAIPYHESIEGGEFEHMAIVENPRYEDCTIRMNSKPAKLNAGDSTEAIAWAKGEILSGQTVAIVKSHLIQKFNLSATKAEAIAWIAADQAKHNSHASEFDKESQEHPEFKPAVIEQIVEDHEKENAEKNITKILHDLNIELSAAHRSGDKERAEMIMEQIKAAKEKDIKSNVKRSCPDCGGALVVSEETSGPWGNFYKCPTHGIISSQKIVYDSKTVELKNTRFKFKSKTSSGRILEDYIEANDEAHAKRQIEAGGTILVSLEKANTKNNKEEKQMGVFSWFKRKNAQAIEDKEKGTKKFNAADIFVDVNGRKVSISDLEKHMIEKENAEAEAKAKEGKETLEPISMDEQFLASNGKEYKIGEMVNSFLKKEEEEKEAAAKKENEDKAAKEAEEKAKKENADKEKTIGDLEKEEGDKEEAELKKKNAAEAEAKAKEEEEEKVKKENAKKVGAEHFATLHNAGTVTDADVKATTAMTRDDRAELGRRRYGSKK